MVVSFRAVILMFALIIVISAVQLIRISFFPHSPSHLLTAQQQRQDIRQLLNEVNRKSAFAALEQKRKQLFNQAGQRLLLATTAPSNSTLFQIKLQAWLTLLNDPAVTTKLSSVLQQARELKVLQGQLSFDGKYWRMITDSGELLNKDHPYVSHIDGLPMSRWVTAAQCFIADSLKLSTTEQSRWLKKLNQLRLNIGLALSNTAVVTLTNNDGDSLQQHSKLVIAAKSLAPAKRFIGSEQALLQSKPLRYATEPALKAAFFQQLNAHRYQRELLLDLRQLTLKDQQLMQWLQDNAAPNQPPVNRVLGLIRYKRYPTAQASQFTKQLYTPFKQLGFFEQVQLEAAGFNSQLDNSHSFSHWLVRQPHTAKVNPAASRKSISLILDSSCQQECEWLTMMLSRWPNVQLVGEKTRGSLSPRHNSTLPNSGISVSYSAALAYNAQGKLISGVGITPNISLSKFAATQKDHPNMLASKAQNNITAAASSKQTMAETSP